MFQHLNLLVITCPWHKTFRALIRRLISRVISRVIIRLIRRLIRILIRRLISRLIRRLIDVYVVQSESDPKSYWTGFLFLPPALRCTTSGELSED